MYRIDPSSRMRRQEEAIEILRLTSSQEEARYQGRYNEFNNITVLPRPIQQPIPIWVTANPDPGKPKLADSLGKSTIQLLAPEGEGDVQQIIKEKGEGPFALSFSVQSLEQTRTFLELRGIRFVQKTAEIEKLVLDPSETYGIGISFVS